MDDDPFTVTLVGQQLQGAGFIPRSAASAAQARALLDSERFDLLLLDVSLPGEDGYSLCRDLRSHREFQDMPVIFMTARGSESDVLRGFDAGGVDYVVKPFLPRVMIARVTAHGTLARLSRGLQATLDARTRSLRLAHRRMRELDSQMALAEERERRHLADLLHDTTIQQLVLARILLDSPTAGIGDGVTDRIPDLLDQSLAQLRSLIFELSPPVLYQGGLSAALQWLADQFGRRWGLRFDCSVEGAPATLPDDLKVILFQGARELMTNVVRHARAESAEVILTFGSDTLCLRVSDDGDGFDPGSTVGQPRPGGGGFGLFSLRSRIELLGGAFDIRRRESGGTRAVIEVPLSPESA